MQNVMNQISEAASTRREQWKAVATSETQRLLKEASTLHDLIKNAKTDTKRNYFLKKFKKVQSELFQMVTVHEHLNRSEQADAAQAAENSSDVVEVADAS